MAGLFVTLEGPEGAGKTTVQRGLVGRSIAAGRSALATRQPGGTPAGAGIREILLHGGDLAPQAELFLFLADRAQHVAEVVRPALAEGRMVICDRYADSTVVYQGYGRGLDLGLLRSWNAVATGGLVPDLTLLLDLPPEVGLARQTKGDRLDQEALDFHQKVRDGFLTEARLDARWVLVDATAPLDDVVERCWSAICERL